MSNKTLEALVSELDANIPRSAVKTREGAGKRAFSYLSADYVIDRLNKVVGQLNWASATEENKAVFEGLVKDGYGKEKLCVSYIARVRIEVQHIDENGRITRTSHTGTGYGDGSDGSNMGKAHELAAKEAESDALKRAAKNLGQSMGLALYDKDQTNVEDDSRPAGFPAAQASTPTLSPNGNTSDSASARPKAVAPHADRPSAVGAHSNRESLMKNLSSISKIVVAKNLTTVAELKEKMKESYGTDVKENLTDAQAEELLARLNKLAA